MIVFLNNHRIFKGLQSSLIDFRVEFRVNNKPKGKWKFSFVWFIVAPQLQTADFCFISAVLEAVGESFFNEGTEGATARKRSGKRTTAFIPPYMYMAGKLTLESDHTGDPPKGTRWLGIQAALISQVSGQRGKP